MLSIRPCRNPMEPSVSTLLKSVAPRRPLSGTRTRTWHPHQSAKEETEEVPSDEIE